jgi:hypothetical protein
MIKLYEAFAQSRNNIIRRYFDDLLIDINKWFTEGSLSQNTTLLEVEESNTSQGTSRSIITDFEDADYRFQLIFFIDQGMFEDEKLTKVVLTLKRYDTNGNLLDNYEEEVPIQDINEDFIIDKITNIEEIGKFKVEPANVEGEISTEMPTEETPPTEEAPAENPTEETPA